MLGTVDWYGVLMREAGVIEEKLDVRLVIDRRITDELGEMAKKTLVTFNQTKPSAAKIAGNVVFWMRKLKPIHIAQDSHNAYLLVNELLAVLVGIGICNLPTVMPPTKVTMSKAMRNDLITSLRYHSHSPNSLAMFFEALI
jgi:hypothetical protein